MAVPMRTCSHPKEGSCAAAAIAASAGIRPPKGKRKPIGPQRFQGGLFATKTQLI